jgi:carbon storage regulator
MLVLSRKMEESIMIGSKIEVTVLSVANGRVKLGIRAPKDVRVLRGELQNECEAPLQESSHSCKVPAPRLAVERKVISNYRKTHPLHVGAEKKSRDLLSVETCCQ